jgi:hypothetical protein
MLQYHIKLAADGLVDGPPGGLAPTTVARLDLLLERRTAWRALRPQAPHGGGARGALPRV